MHGEKSGENGEKYCIDTYSELAILPDKIARFVYGYHSESYSSLQLPPLSDDKSNFDVHGMLTPHKVNLHTIHTQYLLHTLLTVYKLEPFWTRCIYYGHLQAETISFFTIPLLLVTKTTQEINEIHPGRLLSENGEDQITRTVFIRPFGIAQGALELRRTMYDFVSFISFSK
jgi:hypothetical protein